MSYGRRKKKRAPEPRPSAVGGVVTAIRPVRGKPDLAWVSVDGRRAGRASTATLEALGVRVGVAWTAAMEGAVRAEELRSAAKSYALKALAARPLSTRMLADRITARGYPPETAAAVVEDLTRVGLLDDAAFARAYVSSQLSRKAAGRVLLLSALRKKKVDDATARAAVDEALGGADLVKDAASLASRRLRAMRPDLEPDVKRRRLFGMLARRGFDVDTCREAVDRVMKAAGYGRPGIRGIEEE